VALVKAAPKVVVLNHMEALDHCGTTREMIKERLSQEGLLDKVCNVCVVALLVRAGRCCGCVALL
jgi:hypothetical protein